MKKQGGQIKHNMSKTRLYNIWYNMVRRCTNPTHKDYMLYGAKGITVCSQWLDPIVFKQWAEDNNYQDNLTLDRKDNLLNYSPENCRFVSLSIQSRNRGKLKNNTSGYTGVDNYRNKWRATIYFNKKRRYLGIFDNKESAVRARNIFILENNLKEFKIQQYN